MSGRAGQVALVTGGSQGIGLATVEALAGLGMAVAAMARDAGRLSAAVADLGEACLPVPGDVSDEDSVRAAIAATVARFGRLDVLVNAAGVSMSARTRLADTTSREWQRLLTTNLTGTYLMCREALPHLEASPDGFIVNVQSTASHRAGAGTSLYAATKFGVRALSESLVEECRATGVRVSAVSPGPVDTTIWTHKLVPPSAEERARMLRPQDIARLVAFLVESPAHMHVADIVVTPWNRT